MISRLSFYLSRWARMRREVVRHTVSWRRMQTLLLRCDVLLPLFQHVVESSRCSPLASCCPCWDGPLRGAYGPNDHEYPRPHLVKVCFEGKECEEPHETAATAYPPLWIARDPAGNLGRWCSKSQPALTVVQVASPVRARADYCPAHGAASVVLALTFPRPGSRCATHFTRMSCQTGSHGGRHFATPTDVAQAVAVLCRTCALVMRRPLPSRSLSASAGGGLKRCAFAPKNALPNPQSYLP